MALVLLGACAGLSASAASQPPLADPVALNIGLSCQWQQKCIKTQKKAMKRALVFVKKSSPPTWRIHMCNRNASRTRGRVDWVGFDNCIRNAALVPQRSPARRRSRPLS